jgi:hypothetical protein
VTNFSVARACTSHIRYFYFTTQMIMPWYDGLKVISLKKNQLSLTHVYFKTCIIYLYMSIKVVEKQLNIQNTSL